MTIFRSLLFLTIVVLLFSGKVYAQDIDTTSSTAPVKRKDPRPRNAAIRSAIIPGWGQAYNRKYWKVPIIYAAGGTIGAFLWYNNKEYKFYRDQVRDFPSSPQTEINRLNRDQFREWRDWNIVMLIGLYALNIIDANVDAHLREFDVGESLSFSIKPYLCPNQHNYQAVTGLSLNLTFKK